MSGTAAALGLLIAQADAPLRLRSPALSRTHVAFSYAGDLWTVRREDGAARRLTAGLGLETAPAFSPDGAWIAFSGEYGGEANLDVYVVPAAGGVPRRLTYHPGEDVVVGWTPDGKRVLFRSGRASYSRFTRLFTIGLEGGLPEEIPLPLAHEGSFSPDGQRLAYVPYTPPPVQAWKRYRGGTATKVWIANLADSTVERVPRTDANDWNPMWVGETVYFLSDRGGKTTL